MTVKELIERLQQYDPNDRVVLSGYEGGLDDVTHLTKIKIEENRYQYTRYYGPHGEIWEHDERTPGITAIKVE
jgi:hypothetical protein